MFIGQKLPCGWPEERGTGADTDVSLAKQEQQLTQKVFILFIFLTEFYFQLTTLCRIVTGSIRYPNYPTWISFQCRRRSNLILNCLNCFFITKKGPMLVTNSEGCKEESWMAVNHNHSHCRLIPQTGDSHDGWHQCYSPAPPKAAGSRTSCLQHCIFYYPPHWLTCSVWNWDSSAAQHVSHFPHTDGQPSTHTGIAVIMK